MRCETHARSCLLRLCSCLLPLLTEAVVSLRKELPTQPTLCRLFVCCALRLWCVCGSPHNRRQRPSMQR